MCLYGTTGSPACHFYIHLNNYLFVYIHGPVLMRLLANLPTLGNRHFSTHESVRSYRKPFLCIFLSVQGPVPMRLCLKTLTTPGNRHFPSLGNTGWGGGRQWAALPPDPVYVSSPQAMRLLHPASWGRIVSGNILNMFTIKPSTLSSIYSVMSHPRPPMAALLVAIHILNMFTIKPSKLSSIFRHVTSAAFCGRIVSSTLKKHGMTYCT